jgi:flagellar biosynthetic protein FlhB
VSEEKTEDPTPKRLNDARKKGQVAQSKEVTSTAIAICLFAVLAIAMGTFLRRLQEMILFPASVYQMDFPDALNAVFGVVFSTSLAILAPVISVAFIVALMAGYFQVGVLFAFEPIKPDLKKINPGAGVKKIFSGKNLIELLKSVFKIGFLGILLFFVIRDSIDPLMHAPPCGLPCIGIVTGELLAKVLIMCAAAFIIVAAFDFFYQRYAYKKSLKMTKDEVKREYKEMEGNPEIKSQRRQLHQEMLQENMMQNVRQSTVVVTNPTHIAVALRYDEEKTPLPMVVAKGENLLAKRIIEIAQEEGIPVMQNVPLARALNAEVPVDRYIPADLIEPVVQVLQVVRELKEKERAP